MSERDDDRLLDHEYDGIREYDNPMPRWWLATLWGTVIFSVLYALNLPGIGWGRGWIADYAADSTAAAAAAAANDPLAGVTEATLLAVATTPAQLEAGRGAFVTYCAACHLADGGGSIGPNLTDPYWIHGGRPMDVFLTVKNGVLDKGMPNWAASLSPDLVIAVSGYVLTLRGTTPAQPKAAEGVHSDSTTAAQPAGTD